VRGSAKAEKEITAPAFDVDKEYTFSMRSFRFRNGWVFCTVTYNGQNLETLIGQAADYPLPAMLHAKQFGGNVFGTFKGYHDHIRKVLKEIHRVMRVQAILEVKIRHEYAKDLPLPPENKSMRDALQLDALNQLMKEAGLKVVDVLPIETGKPTSGEPSPW